ncbi:unnamed protein product [Polarella glacialis]|uniref:Uncharacterized protein n=1 Tax=Polarella glacialis TaxID=89957 RepID=A0A813JIV1_POLGL|nr:unnamed protein product [Polarella glacialis]
MWSPGEHAFRLRFLRALRMPSLDSTAGIVVSQLGCGKLCFHCCKGQRYDWMFPVGDANTTVLLDSMSQQQSSSLIQIVCGRSCAGQREQCVDLCLPLTWVNWQSFS